MTRAFQYAWPPIAYSIEDDREASRFYALVATYYVLFTGFIVAALTLLGRWALRLLTTPEFYAAFDAMPWVSLGWALYGLFLVLVVMAGRAKVTTRNFPAALAGLAVNVGLLIVLVPPLGIAGAGLALCGAYVVMLALMYALTRRLFVVPFEWARLAHLVAVIGGVTVAGELLLPTTGALGFVERTGALLAIPLLLVATRFLGPGERARLRGHVRAPNRALRRNRMNVQSRDAVGRKNWVRGIASDARDRAPGPVGGPERGLVKGRVSARRRARASPRR